MKNEENYLSFYRDNAYNFEEFKALNYIIKSSEDLLDEMADQVSDNQAVETIRTYSNIPTQIIDASSACYNLKEFLSDHNILSMTGLAAQKNGIDARVSAWETLPIKLKMIALDYANLSILLVSKKEMRDAKDEYHLEFNVVNFDLYTSGGERLIHGSDYYFYQNKIYLLNFGTERWGMKDKLLVMRNIVIDYNHVENTLGESLKIHYNKFFTKTEYKDALVTFTKAALGGPTIKNLNSSFFEDVSLDGLSVIDFKNADPVKKIFWEKQVLTPFDFLVTLPIDFISKLEKLEYIKNFFTTIKPAYTNFTFIPEMFNKDQLLMRYLFGRKEITAITDFLDKIPPGGDKIGDDTGEFGKGFLLRHYRKEKIKCISIVNNVMSLNLNDLMSKGRDYLELTQMFPELNPQNSCDNIKSKETINKKSGEITFIDKASAANETIEFITYDSGAKFDKPNKANKYDSSEMSRGNATFVDRVNMILIPKI